MNFHAPSYGVAAPAAAPMSVTKIVVIIAVVVVVGTVVFLGVVAIALGVGLGIGLRKSNSPITKLSAPTVNCDSSATCGCASTKPIFSSRIVNGNMAAANSWPWMVYLSLNSTKTCSGFLVSQRHVITASSCVKNYGTNITISYGSSASQSTIGGLNVSSTNYTMDVYDSVAIVTLGINLTYTSTIRPCCLTADLTQPYIGTNGVVAGWGETSTTNLGTISPFLEQAVIQVLNPSNCNVQGSDYQFCAGFNTISTCPIDIGGPLMVGLNNAWTCVGVVTGSTTSCNNPTTFTRVAAYQAFIKNITGLIF